MATDDDDGDEFDKKLSELRRTRAHVEILLVTVLSQVIESIEGGDTESALITLRKICDHYRSKIDN